MVFVKTAASFIPLLHIPLPLTYLPFLLDLEWYSMSTWRWPYRLLLIYVGWFIASSMSHQVPFYPAQALYNAAPWSSNQNVNARWTEKAKTVLTSILILWCHSTLLLDTFNVTLLTPIPVDLGPFPLGLLKRHGGARGERLDGRKSQKGKKNGEMEWCLPGRERGGTEPNDVLLMRFCCLGAKAELLLGPAYRIQHRVGAEGFSQSTMQMNPSPLGPLVDEKLKGVICVLK